MLSRDWVVTHVNIENDFVVLPSGNTIRLEDFMALFENTALNYSDLCAKDTVGTSEDGETLTLGYRPLFDTWKEQGLIE